MESKFFKTYSERELWIKLNAERQIECEKGLTFFDKERYSLEEMLTLDI